MNRSTPGLPVHHQLPEFTQTHVHQVGDAIQPSHPLSSPSPPAPNPSQHQGLFQRVNSSHEEAKVLEFQLQHQSFQWTPRTDLLQDGLVGSPCSPRDSQESSQTPQLLNHKKEQIWAICGDMDGCRDCHTEWSKSEREKQIWYINAYMWNLEKWYRWSYLQSRNEDTDGKNKCMETKGQRGGVEWIGRHTTDTMYKTYNK